MRAVYLDHNSTTPVRPEVLDAMLPFLRGGFGNPESVHALGQEARAAVEAAREKVAALINAFPDEVVFASCGSEANALAVLGAAAPAEERGGPRRAACSAVEHASVLGLMDALAARGFELAELPADRHGMVPLDAALRALMPDTAIVSLMHSNNEVGTLQPVRELAAACRERGIVFHTDAVQSAGKVPLDVSALGVDLLSISGHKLNAPKGVAALYVRRGTRLRPQIAGRQERGLRGGTLAVASVAGFGAACGLAAGELARSAARLLGLRRRLEEGLRAVPGCRVNGHPVERLPGTCHASFEGLDGHALAVALDLEGVAVSSGPACSAGARGSRTLAAMGIEESWALGSVRFSMGLGSTEADVDRALEVLPGAVARLRAVRV